MQAIPLVQLFLFAIFGVNQMLGSVRLYADPLKPSRWWWTYMHSEVFYTVLSLTAKSLLAWLLFGGTMNNDPKLLVSHSLC